MKLLKLKLNNFRTFYGEQVLDLSTDDGKPSILIFGNNGAGKTTLLNAFTWALYGTFTDDVEQQHRIIHDKVWTDTPFGKSVSASVELQFEHEGSRFMVARDVTVIKKKEEQASVEPNLIVTETKPDGETKSGDNHQDRIQKILPQGLRRFFFFNGERMEKMLTGNENSEEVQQAIKTLLGLEAIERAVDIHLPKVASKLSRGINKGTSQLNELGEQKEQLERIKSEKQKEIQQLDSDIRSYQKEVQSVEGELRKNDQAAPLQDARDNLSDQIKDAHSKLNTLKERKRDFIAKSGFLAFTGGIDQTVIKMAEAMRRRRELPAGIQRSFIDELLEDCECICGRALVPKSPEYEELIRRRYNAGLADVESRWLYLNGQMRNLNDERTKLLEDLTQNAQEEQNTRQVIDRLNEKRSDLDRRLDGINVQDVQILEQRRKDYMEKEKDARVEKLHCKHKLNELEEQIQNTRRKYRSAEVADEAERKVQHQVSLIDEVLDAFKKIRVLKTEEVRQQLDAKMKEVFSRIFIKSYTPELNDAFELQLKSPAGVAIRSTGENQILSLSFVGAVSEVAKEIHELKKHDQDEVLGGGIYPIVMDAPFGNLDVTYQEEISQALPALTSQIITLLSQAQARGKVMKKLQGSATRMYVLHSYTPNREAKEETIEINNRAVPYVSYGDFEHTIVEKVTV
ncbi:AAA family ATPase [Nocardiopsis sp. FIRDI 009]|uniref:AAA family ATPase n=1 Tax=Nocardiopsis sp. FIRDI 009 TaxID=714197 RepID=UPI000E27BF11|nr:AAA family ATPase [Nocardiopsis sp. FIRDI 009]